MAEREEFGSRRYVLPSGDGNTPLQIVRWTEQRVAITLAGSSDRALLPTGTVMIELTATENCYVNFGDVTVVASTTIANNASRLFLAGVQVVPVPIDPVTDEPYTYIAAIQDATAGVLQAEQVA